MKAASAIGLGVAIVGLFLGPTMEGSRLRDHQPVRR